MNKILAVIATVIVLTLSVVGCGSSDAEAPVKEEPKNSLWDYTTKLDEAILNNDGSLIIPEIKINGMTCIALEEDTQYHKILIFDCDWNSKGE